MQQLSNFGFSNSMIKVYDALLKHVEASATTLAKEAGVPSSKIYQILNQLIEKGICYEIIGPKRTFKLIDPQQGFKKLKDEQELKVNLLEELTLKCSQQFLKNVSQQENDTAKIITSQQAIIQTFYKMFDECQQEGIGFIKGPYLTDISKLQQNKSQIESIKNGRKYRAIYEIGDHNEEEVRAIAKYFASAGEEVRIHPKLPIKMVVMDKKKLLLSLESNAKSGTMAIILNHNDLGLLFTSIFENYWEESTPI